jgi:hypothetical protein
VNDFIFDARFPSMVGGGEVAAVAGLDGDGGERDSEVGFAAAGLTEEQDRPVLVDEPQRRQVLDQLAVDRWLELVVEVVDAAPVREPRVTQSGRQPAIPVGGCLLGDESGEELDVRPVLGAGLVGERREHACSSVQLQVAEVGFDLFVEAAHPTFSASMSSG